jgi:hypothetical protein
LNLLPEDVDSHPKWLSSSISTLDAATRLEESIENQEKSNHRKSSKLNEKRHHQKAAKLPGKGWELYD